VITEETVADAFGASCTIIPEPVTGTLLCVPRAELPALRDRQGEGRPSTWQG